MKRFFALLWRVMDDVRHAVEKRPLLVSALLFMVALLARLALVLTSRFTGDEITFWDQAHKIAKGQEFPLLGPSITGGGARHPGPLLYYIIAIPLLVNPAPEAANVFVAALGAVTVIIFWRSLRPFFGERGALLAGLMMACSPWSTLYADRIWNPNIIGFFVALSFSAACRLRKQPALWPVIVLFVSQAAMPHLHMSSPMVWLALLPIWLPSVRRWRWWWPLVALALAATLYIPMLIHELKTDWFNTKTFLAETASNTSTDWQRVPLWAFRLFTLDVSYHQLHSYWGTHTEKEMFAFIQDGNSDFHYSPMRHALLALSVLFAVFTLGLAVFRTSAPLGRAVFRFVKDRRWSWGWWKRSHPFFWAGLVGLFANVLLLKATHKDVFGHYVQPLLPFYFVAFADLGLWSGKGLRTPLVWGTALLVCVGGIDAAVWVSQTMDARNGLLTMRRVIAAVEREQPDATRVGLGFGFRNGSRASLDGYNVLLGLDPKHKLRFTYGSQYLLMFKGDPQPTGGRVVMDGGSVLLYRMQ